MALEGLGVATNIIAIIELSTKIESICLDYSSGVQNASNDIAQVVAEIINLKTTADSALQVLRSPDGAKLEVSQQLLGAVKAAVSRLEQLDAELRPASTRKYMGSLEIRALKWPLQSNDIENFTQDIARCIQTISTGLQNHQKSILLEPAIKNEILSFLGHELSQIRDDYNGFVSKEQQLPLTWPGQSNIRTIVSMSGPSFIFAITACHFINDRIHGDPNRQLERVLNVDIEAQSSGLKPPYMVKLMPGSHWDISLHPEREPSGIKITYNDSDFKDDGGFELYLRRHNVEKTHSSINSFNIMKRNDSEIDETAIWRSSNIGILPQDDEPTQDQKASSSLPADSGISFSAFGSKENPKYSSGDCDDNAQAEDSWLNMHRQSTSHTFTPRPNGQNLLQRGRGEIEPGITSPTTAIAPAVTDQLSAQPLQSQQDMAIHLPSTPQISTLPRTPILPDHHTHILAQQTIEQGDSSLEASGPSDSTGFGGNTFTMSTESQLLKLLELIDLDDNSRMSRLDLRRSTGQTMLHMGCALGYHRFVSGLLARGANPDLRDRGGFTPMHLAALNDNESIVCRLIQAGANPTIRSLSGLRPADVARSYKVIKYIRRYERHIQSQSGGSLHSRAISATSLRSLWDPLGVSSESESADNSECPGYSSGDYDDDEQEDDSWLDMRRRHTSQSFTPRPDRQKLLRQDQGEMQSVLTSSTANVALVVRDQFSAQIQQFKQAMTMHFPNLPQIPSLMPNIFGLQAGLADEEAPRQKWGKWWDLMPFRDTYYKLVPPPAYDELFPQAEIHKPAAAIRAAVEAAADIKCAALYDTQTTEIAEASSSKAPDQVQQNPIYKGVKETQCLEHPKPHRWSSVVHRGNKLFAWLFDLWSPPEPGYQRVRYICACGDDMFLDVKELSPGGLERFRQRLATDGLATIIAAQDSTTDVLSGLSPPPSAYIRSERSNSGSSRESSDLSSSSSRTRSSTPPSPTSCSDEESSQHDEHTSLQYLLLCVNQKSLPVLVHIDCSAFENDQYLFQKILESYQMIQEGSTWKISFLLPLSVSTTLNNASTFLEKNIPSCLEWLFRFFRLLSEISFFKMDSGDFVRFQLVPVGETIVPSSFKRAELPPPSEVSAGNYLYEPVPMLDVEFASIPLWHLTRPGIKHSDKYWVTTFPKKLRYPLQRNPGVYGRPTVGWGIRINECFNWDQFLFLLLIVTVIIGAIVGIYMALKSDPSSAFGLGAFLAAIAAIYIPYQYFSWKEKVD